MNFIPHGNDNSMPVFDMPGQQYSFNNMDQFPVCIVRSASFSPVYYIRCKINHQTLDYRVEGAV